MSTQQTVAALPSRAEEWMREAIRLATESVSKGGGPFGAVIGRGEEIVATGTNMVTSDLDPTAHAEITAIRNACRNLNSFRLDGCVLISSCEPCPMCMASALWSRLDRIGFAADRHDAAVAGFDDRAFYDLFTDPDAVWPTPVRRLETANRTEPFDAWQNKADRVEY
ncbi:nucleoside deaminase [Actinopolyspora sp. H202]|uniref:nucleoside deaminase n=1 Tax=Actinopolyspora sp. H202 TaxID=1500456 RepID=UPI003EE7F3F0